MTKCAPEFQLAPGWSRREVLALAGATLALPLLAKAQGMPDDVFLRTERAGAAARAIEWPVIDDHGDRLARPAARLAALTVPRPLPALHLTPLEATGQMPRFAGSTGVLLHFWAPWCAPCLRELPLIIAGARAAGVTILAVSTDKRMDVVRRFCSRLEVPASLIFIQENIQDAEGLLLGGILPATLVVDASGLVRARAIGEVEWRSPESWRLVARWCR